MNGKFLVDTNVIIRLLYSDERSVELFDMADEVYIPVIVAGELYYGAENSTKEQENKQLFSDFISQYNVVDIDLPITKVYGEIKTQLKSSGLTIPENDLWIAATAMHHQLTLITFDNHFSNINGLQVIN